MRQKRKLLVAGWSFTSKCNLKCKHCYNASGKSKSDELTFEQAKKVAQKLVDYSVAAVNFGGGECPLRTDFPKICKLLHEGGVKLSLTTNGLPYKEVAKYMHLFHDIGVSIDFADEKRQDWFRGIKGAYKLACKAARFFAKQGIDTEIVTCITKLNCNPKELKKIYELAKKLGVNHWRLNRYRPTGRKEIQDLLKLEPSDIKLAYSFLDKLIRKDFVIPDPLFANFGRKVAACPSGKTSFRIMSNGEVSPDVYLKISGGNILKKDIDDIRDSDIFRAIRNRDLKGTKCEVCQHLKTCQGGCAGSAFLAYGTFDKPDPLCWNEPKWNVHEKYLCTAYVPLFET